MGSSFASELRTTTIGDRDANQARAKARQDAMRMRVGMRLSERSCCALVLNGRDIVGRAEHRNAATLAEAIDSVFARLATDFGAEIVEVTADVADALQVIGLTEVVAIRISPRPPMDRIHEMNLPPPVAGKVTQTVHVRGGHDIRGRELAPLGIDEFVSAIPRIFTGRVRTVAITAVGATASPAHELAVADAISVHDDEMKIRVSQDFYSNVFRDRDLTTVLNSAYVHAGEQVEALLEGARNTWLPAATVSYVKNDGGRGPLAQLSETPVHALFARWPARLVGAATVAGIRDGKVFIGGNFGRKVGRFHDGVPMVGDEIRQGIGAGLASNFASMEDYSTELHRHQEFSAVVVELDEDAPLALPDELTASVISPEDLALVGCGSAPLTAWVDRLVTVANEVELLALHRLAEADAYSAAALAGASPTRLRLAESNVFAMPYGHPGIVRVRVQAVGAIHDGDHAHHDDLSPGREDEVTGAIR